MSMNYFGTDLVQAGHYFWELKTDEMRSLSYGMFKVIPFDPEGIFTSDVKNGSTFFLQIGDYTVYGICGSPVDKRQNCKSIFFVKDIISREDIISRIKCLPVAMKIIKTMEERFSIKLD